MSSPLTDIPDSDMTDITHLLKSNEAPDASETIVLQQEVDVLVPTVFRLRAQLKEAEERLLRCRSALSAIRKLPQEILAQIFCIAYDQLEDKEKRSFLATLGQVSKAWHGAAYDPSHWADVLLVLGDAKFFETLGDVETLFENAKNNPRTLTLWGSGCRCGNPTEPPQEWLYCLHQWRVAAYKLLCSASPIQRLAFKRSSLQCFANLVASLDSDLDLKPRGWLSLSSLELQFVSFPAVQMPPSGPRKAVVTFDLADVPESLTDLSLSLSACTDGVVARLNINVSALKNLTSFSIICDWEAPVILDSLRHCTNLNILHLNYGWSTQSWKDIKDVDTSDVLLPNLHTLDLQIRKPTAAAKVLPLLKLPKLVNLRIFTNSEELLHKSLDCLGMFSSGKSLAPILRSLSIWFVPGPYGGPPSLWMEPKDLVDTLSHIPSLQHLALDSIFFEAGKFVEIIKQSVQHGDPRILPAIESIEVINPVTIMGIFDFDTFLRWVEVRRRPSELESLRGTVRRPDCLRRITIGHQSRRKDGSSYSNKLIEHPWELAANTIELLKESYDVVVDRIFVSDGWKRLRP